HVFESVTKIQCLWVAMHGNNHILELFRLAKSLNANPSSDFEQSSSAIRQANPTSDHSSVTKSIDQWDIPADPDLVDKLAWNRFSRGENTTYRNVKRGFVLATLINKYCIRRASTTAVLEAYVHHMEGRKLRVQCTQ
ncbi:MAG: hypothetical protein ACKPKO_05210, partial [Candidatus Fonsibacter sp.]